MKFVPRQVAMLLILFSGSFSIRAQTLKGSVKDDKGEPVIGATVAVVGETVAIAADLEGKYLLKNIPAKRVDIEVKAMGFAVQRKSFDFSSGQDELWDVTMQEDALRLSELVVVGYGLEQKRDITGSISTIKSKDINNTPQPSFEQAIQGRAAGVQVTAANGVAGAPVKINIRGTNSITAGSEPLYVVDGIPITSGDFSPGNLGSRTSALADINPADIESIEILKDAAAAAIYGSRGANGVVIITTKKGKAGKTSFNFEYTTGSLEPTNRLEFLSAREHLQLRDRYFLGKTGEVESDDNPLLTTPGGIFTRAMADSFASLPQGIWNWQVEAFGDTNRFTTRGSEDIFNSVLRTGTLQQANLTASGGNDKTTFYFGTSYRDEKGFLVGNDFKRINTRLNLDNQATDRIKIGFAMNFGYTLNDRVPIGDAGGLGRAQRRLPYLPLYNEDGTYFDPYNNPLWELETKEFRANIFRTISNAYAEVKLMDGLLLRSAFGLDLLNQWEKEFNFRNTQDTGNQSSAWDRRTNVFNWTTNHVLNYSKRFNSVHDVTALIGGEAQQSDTRGVGLQGVGFSNDALTEPANALALNGYNYATGFRFNSAFARAGYKYKDRYLLNASIRRDGSSRFGPGNKHGIFPSAGAGWIISDEAFLKSFKALSHLKIRASYGQTGNANIGDFAWRGVFTTGNGYFGQQGIYPSSLANENLRWEKSSQFDVNLDVAFFRNRIAASATYYNKRSVDLLLYVNTPTSSGFGSVLQNIGELSNEGLEFTINTKNIEGEFTWNTDFNIAFNANTVLAVNGLPPDAFESGEPGEGRVLQGYPVGQSYLVEYAGIQKENGVVYLYNEDGSKKLDANGAHMFKEVNVGTDLYYDRYGNIMTWENPTGNFYDNRKPMGRPIPKFFGGITNTFGYKGLELSFLLSFVYGNTIYDDPAKQQIGAWNNEAQRREILEAWPYGLPGSDVPALSNNYTAINSSRFLYDGSFIRLRNLSLAYNLPLRWIEKAKLSSMRIYLNGGNLLTWTRYPGWDPEVLRNVDPNSQQGNVSFSGPSYQTPQTRSVLLGIKVGF